MNQSKEIARHNALAWWNKLVKSVQRDLETQTFGYGDWWEDNTLCENDIISMHKRFVVCK